jgi:hypothetical protein
MAGNSNPSYGAAEMEIILSDGEMVGSGIFGEREFKPQVSQIYADYEERWFKGFSGWLFLRFRTQG